MRKWTRQGGRSSLRRLTLAAALAALALAGCATVPEQIQGDFSDISPARVEPAAFGTSVRWGGVIIDAVNEADTTCFEILSRDLDKYMRPLQEDRTAGRFIACKPGFHDPEIFAAGREVTLTGSIRGIDEREIDQFKYRYPIVDVDEMVLWQPRREVMVIDRMYDPFWYPYPYSWGRPYWGYYPYYWHRYPMHSRAYIRQTLPAPAETRPRQ